MLFNFEALVDLAFAANSCHTKGNMSTVTVHVETKTVVRVMAAAGIFIGAILLLWQAWSALLVIFVSFIFAIALNRPISFVSRHLPGGQKNRALATTIAFLLFLIVFGSFVYVAVPPAVDQTVKFVDNLPGYIFSLRERGGIVADFINHYNLQNQVDQLVAGMQQQAGTIAQGAASSVVGGLASFFNGFVTVITIIILTFLMLVEGPSWVERYWHLYTNQTRLERHHRLADKLYKVVSGYVAGQVVVSTIAAALGLLMLIILTNVFSVSSSAVIPLTGLIFVTGLIPLIGSIIGAALVVFVLLFNDVGAAFTFLVYYLVYMQIENNFIQPMVQSRTVAVSALSVLVALVIGFALLGLLGGILAIPLAGCVRVMIEDYMEHREHKAVLKKAEPKPRLA